MNKFQWNFYRNSNIFIEENTFENVVCEMSAILSRSHCVNNGGRHRKKYQPFGRTPLMARYQSELSDTREAALSRLDTNNSLLKSTLFKLDCMNQQ